MFLKSILTFFAAFWGMIFLSSCTTSKIKAKDVATSVHYTVARGYFVKNTFKTDSVQCLLIRNREQLDSLLGVATTMGKDGMPTRIDFQNQYAIACIHPETNQIVQWESSELKLADDQLTLYYSFTTGEKQSFTMVPLQLLVVEGNPPGIFVTEITNSAK